MKRVLFILATLIFAQSGFGQVFPYQFDTKQKNYSDLENDTALGDGSPWDDPEYVIPIGFNFTFFDKTFNQLYVSDAAIAALVDFDSPYGVIGVAHDLIDRGYDMSSSRSTISYVLEGATGNRILKIQWKNVGFYSTVSDGLDNDYLNFQIWLYESDNSFEYHFGDNFVLERTLSYDGMKGLLPAVLFEEILDDDEADFFGLLSGNTTNPDFVSNMGVSEDDYDDLLYNTSLDGEPTSGQVYRFERNTSSTSSLQLSAESFQVAPNPIADYFKITNLNQLDINRISFTGVNGQEMINNDQLPDQKTHYVNTGELPKGIYFLQIQTPQGVWNQKIVKD